MLFKEIKVEKNPLYHITFRTVNVTQNMGHLQLLLHIPSYFNDQSCGNDACLKWYIG